MFPLPILEQVLSYLVSGSKTDRLHAMLVCKVWLKQARKAYYPMKTLHYASEMGHLELVKELLSDSRIDPSARDNKAIRLASEHGHLEVVQELLRILV